MPFGVEVYGQFIELRAWRTLLGRPQSVFRLAAHFCADSNQDSSRE